MINLRYQFNACMTELPEFGTPKFDVAPVLLKNGDFKRVKWLGYIDIEDARGKPNAKPVKLDIAYYSVSADQRFPKWRDIPKGLAIQGCLTAKGVYCVLGDGRPVLVPR